MPISKQEALAEAYKRGILPDNMKSAYEEAQKRGLINTQTPSQDYSGVGEGLQSALQGASFGLGEELQGGLKGAGYGIGAAIKGENVLDAMQQGYGQEVANRRAKQEQFGKDYPVAKMGAEIAGGLAMPMGGQMAKYIGQGATTTGRALRSAGVGAGVGGAYGLGSQGGVGERLTQGAIGAGMGGATGGILSPTAEKLMAGLRPSGLNKTDKFIRSNIPVGKAGQLSEDLAQATAQGRITQLPDVGGADLQQAIRKMRTTGAKEIIDSALDTRSKAENARLSRLLEDEFGANKFLQNIDDIELKYGQQAKPLYDMAYEAPVFQSEVIDDLLQTPAMQSALKTAEKKAVNERIPLYSEGGYNTRQIDYIKRALDDKISVAQRAGRRDESRILTGIKNEMLDEIDSLNPIYKEARDMAGEKIRTVKAQEEGFKFDSKLPEAIERQMKKMTPPEKEAYLLGAKEKLVKKSAETATTGTQSNKIFGNPQKENQIKALFDNQQEYQAFAQSLQDEIKAGIARNAMTGGSQTAENMSPSLAKTAINLMYNPRATAADMAFRAGNYAKGVNPQTVAKQMFEPSQAGNIDSLRRIAQFEAGIKPNSRLARLLQQIPITSGQRQGNK